jgi:hypothetical protein
LQYNLNRWYDPVIGQWMSEDPIGLGPDANSRRFVENQAIALTDPSGLAPPMDTYFTDGPGSRHHGYGNGLGEWIPYQNSNSFPRYPDMGDYELAGEAWIRYNPDGSVSIHGELFVVEENGCTWRATPNEAELALWNWNRTKDDKYLDDPLLKNNPHYIRAIARSLADPRGASRNSGYYAAAEMLRPSPDHPGLHATPRTQVPSTRGSSSIRPPGTNWRNGSIKEYPGSMFRDASHNQKHLPGTSASDRLIRKEGSAHVFNNEATLCSAERMVLAKGQYLGESRGWVRYGLRLKDPVGYRIDAAGNKVPLNYVELKIDPRSGAYHVVPRTGPSRR